MEVKKLLREDNRIIGGVCSGISEKYSQYIWANIWAIRLLFIIVSWALGGLPILIYLILWITIPSRNQAKKTERQRKYLFQSIGLVIGAIIGGYVGLSFTPKFGFLFMVAFMFVYMPIGIGAIIGFFTTRLILKIQ